jgi:hypothetical protein
MRAPAATSTVTYLMPVVSVVLGAAFLGEPVGANLIAGTTVVLLGVALAQRRGRASVQRDRDHVIGHRDQALRCAAGPVGHDDLDRVS